MAKVINSLGAVIDAFDPPRNHGTLGHAKEHLLDPAEASLYINAVKTLMHYLNAKLHIAQKTLAPSPATPVPAAAETAGWG